MRRARVQPDGHGRLEPWNRALLGALPESVVVASLDGTIVFVNELIQQATGFSMDDLIGRRLDLVLPRTVLDVLDGHRDRHAASHDPRATASAMDVLVRRSDGTTYPADIGLSSLDDSDEPLVVFVIRDASNRSERRDRRGRDASIHTVDHLDHLQVEMDAVIHSLFLASASLHVLADETQPEIRASAMSIAATIDEAIRDLRAQVRSMSRHKASRDGRRRDPRPAAERDPREMRREAGQ